MTPEVSMTPEKLTDETHIHVEGWGEMNDHPDIALLAERIVDNVLDGGRRDAEESAFRLTGLLIAFGEHLISAERTRADTLERERDAWKAALYSLSSAADFRNCYAVSESTINRTINEVVAALAAPGEPA